MSDEARQRDNGVTSVLFATKPFASFDDAVEFGKRLYGDGFTDDDPLFITRSGSEALNLYLFDAGELEAGNSLPDDADLEFGVTIADGYQRVVIKTDDGFVLYGTAGNVFYATKVEPAAEPEVLTEDTGTATEEVAAEPVAEPEDPAAPTEPEE